MEFVLVVDQKSSHAERIRIVRYQSVEQDPLAASRLKLLTQLAGAAPPKVVAIGETVPDFRLTNQKRRPVALSDLRGKVVAVNFVYTSVRCRILPAHRQQLRRPPKRFRAQLDATDP